MSAECPTAACSNKLFHANAPVAAYDVGRGLVKVNPLAALSDDDMALYVQLHDLPVMSHTALSLP